jgi:heterodisulfide reductase subunit C/coenzyme F420-reducing hydrogenase delta subunit
VIRLQPTNQAFIDQVLNEPGGEHLLTCWSCGTCAATCLVRRFESTFNPRLILHQAGLGLREQVLASPEIWQCSACDACYPRCPRQIHISAVMGAIRKLAIREGYQSPQQGASVDEQVCSGCAVCTRACPYQAISRVQVDERFVAQVDRNLCMRCGICTAVCPSEAISLDILSESEVVARTSADGWLDQAGMLSGGALEPRILVFVCQWSVRAESELERVHDLGERIRVVNLPCSGRVDPALVLMALQRAADGVILVGCKAGECHYQRGTFLGRSNIAMLQEMLSQVGVAPQRLSFIELGALDRFVLAGLVQTMSLQLVQVAAASGVPVDFCRASGS